MTGNVRYAPQERTGDAQFIDPSRHPPSGGARLLSPFAAVATQKKVL